MNTDVYTFSSRGGREYNEDSLFYVENDMAGLYIVADGLGGHQFGEIASKTACETLASEWKKECSDRKQWLTDALVKANNNILAFQKEKNTVLKSTAVVLAIDDDKACWANVGDSRLYFLHDSSIYSVTEDHSVAYKKYKAGEITKDQIGNDEDQSRLLRSLGSTERYEAQLYESDVLIDKGDAFLLCSDGVWEYLKEEEILIDYFKADSSKDWAERLLVRLMSRIDGKNDNLSLIGVMIR